MKRILYNMGSLTLARWLLQRGLKFEPPFGPRSKLKRVPPTQNFLGKIQCFKPMLFIFFLSGKSPLVEDSTIFFFWTLPLFDTCLYIVHNLAVLKLLHHLFMTFLWLVYVLFISNCWLMVNTFETLWKHPWNFYETHMKLPWNFLEILLKPPVNLLETP